MCRKSWRLLASAPALPQLTREGAAGKGAFLGGFLWGLSPSGGLHTASAGLFVLYCGGTKLICMAATEGGTDGVVRTGQQESGLMVPVCRGHGVAATWPRDCRWPRLGYSIILRYVGGKEGRSFFCFSCKTSYGS